MQTPNVPHKSLVPSSQYGSGVTGKPDAMVQAEMTALGASGPHRQDFPEVQAFDPVAGAEVHISLNDPQRLGEHHINHGVPTGYTGRWTSAGPGGGDYEETP